MRAGTCPKLARTSARASRCVWRTSATPRGWRSSSQTTQASLSLAGLCTCPLLPSRPPPPSTAAAARHRSHALPRPVPLMPAHTRQPSVAAHPHSRSLLVRAQPLGAGAVQLAPRPQVSEEGLGAVWGVAWGHSCCCQCRWPCCSLLARPSIFHPPIHCADTASTRPARTASRPGRSCPRATEQSAWACESVAC